MPSLLDSFRVMADKTLREPVADDLSSVRDNSPGPKPKTDDKVSPNDDDLQTVHETCEYVKNVVDNFNARIDSLGPEAFKKIQDLNSHLAKLLITDKVLKPEKVTAVKRERKSTVPELPKLESSRIDAKLKGASLSERLGIATDTSADDDDGELVAKHKKTGAFSKYLKNTRTKPKKPSRISFGNSFGYFTDTAPEESDNIGGVDGGSEDAGSDKEEIIFSTEDKVKKSNSKLLGSSKIAGHPVSTASLMQVLQRLDNRVIPKPEKFDVDSGQSFEQFFITFESYASETFRGDSSLWVGELGRFLVGEIHSAYNALRVSGDSYSVLRKKLLRWNTDCKEVRDKILKSRFSKARKLPDESFRLYAARLEKAFRLAYPMRGIEKSKALRQKYFDTVPRSFQRQLKTARSIALTMGSSDMTWSNILALASRQDAEEELSAGSGESKEKPMNWSAAVGLSKSRESKTGQSEYQDGEWTACCHSASLTGSGMSKPHPTPAGNSHSYYPTHESSYLNEPAPSYQIQNEQRTCSYCHCVGHLRGDCRRFLNLCLLCGSPDHRISGCTRRRTGPAPAVSSRDAIPHVTPTFPLSYGRVPSSGVARGGGTGPLHPGSSFQSGREMRGHSYNAGGAGANIGGPLNQ